MTHLIEHDVNRIRVIELTCNPHRKNAVSIKGAIIDALQRAGTDSMVKAIVVYGGQNQPFIVGEDFDEIGNLSSNSKVNEWVDRAIDLYICALSITKPTVVAIDGKAEGIGFQFAMMFDFRILSESATLRASGLQNGVSCPLGATILSQLIGWNAARELVLQAQEVSADRTLRYGLINAVCKRERLLERAVADASAFSSYPTAAYSHTKNDLNKILIKNIKNTASAAKQVHLRTFRSIFGSPDHQASLSNDGKDICSKFAAF